MVIADEPTVEKTEDGEDASASTAGSSSIHRFTYRMRRRDCFGSETATLLGEAISVNDPVVLSLEDPPVLAISRGFVLEVSLFEVVVGVDRSLSDLPQLQRCSQATPIYRIDKDELAAGMGRIRDNLLQLFYAGSPNNERRRKLLVGLEPPRFDSAASAAAHTVMPSHLNADQVAAVERVMSARDYALILGMPGTGKTTTTAEIIRALARAGKTVLLTSYTHSAVDNILMKLVDGDGPSILRLGNVDKVSGLEAAVISWDLSLNFCCPVNCRSNPPCVALRSRRPITPLPSRRSKPDSWNPKSLPRLAWVSTSTAPPSLDAVGT